MHQFDTDVNGAILWVVDLVAQLEKKVLEAMTAIPKWGEPIDSHVKQYCDGVGTWVRGHDEWIFEGEKYFGTKGPEVKRNRWVLPLPKDSRKGPKDIGPIILD